MTDLYTRYPALTVCQKDIECAAATLIAMFRAGGKLLLCGNGGSAADCEHIVGELMKSFMLPRRPDATFAARLRTAEPEAAEYMLTHLQRGLPAVSLPGQMGLYSAFCNDVAADMAYAQMTYALGRPGDALLCLSTSGNSRNVVLAAKAARAVGMTVIALTGERESALSAAADITVRVPATETYQVQEWHLPVYHALCMELEAALCGEEPADK